MKILAIDTSSSACSVALLVDGRVVESCKKLPLQQAQSILPMIEALLQENNVELKQLDALAFGCGPGSFTGVRIATSVIQGLAFALDLPVIPISSLAAVAQAAYQATGWRHLWVALDARMQEVYWGAYVVGPEGLVALQGSEVVAKPDQLTFPEGDASWYGVGDGWLVYRDQLHFSPVAIDNSQYPKASAVLELAIPKYHSQDWVSAALALPVYLRDNVAKKSSK